MKIEQMIHVGTSGWHYGHWKGPFYPEDFPEKDFLSYYNNRFSTVEINNSFYRLPQKKTLKEWRETVKKEFIFSVKGSRYITHMKKLKDPQQSLSNFLERIEILEDTLGPILFQLPPRWKCNVERLEAFLKEVPKNHRYTFEFRDTSWFNDQIYETLAKFKAAFCIYELSGTLSPKKITTDFVYIRLHGPGGAYQGKYTRKALMDWAEVFSTWRKEGKEIFCYFDNDQLGFAAQNALELQQIVNNI